MEVHEGGGLVVTRVGAAWCGTCQVLADESAALLTPAHQARVRYRDVLLADEDNAEPSASTVERWRVDHAGASEITLHTELRLEQLFSAARRPLPWVIVQSEDSEEILATLANPTVEQLLAALDGALGESRGAPVPLWDSRFDAFDQALIRGMRLRDQLPPDPGNEVADNAGAAAWGRRLFFDGALSPRGVSCGSCHDPSLLLTDGKGVPPAGAGPGRRNVPSNALASRARWQLWDGRADALWAQALLPFEDPTEFASSRVFVVREVVARHAEAYRSLFGEVPDLSDSGRFPRDGKPGDAAWEAMAPDDREIVTRAFVNVGKALSAFQRSIVIAPNALDLYAAGDLAALTEPQKDGLHAFLRAGCPQCHHGERLTDDAFQNLRFPTGHQDGSADLGRAAGLEALAALELPADASRVAASARSLNQKALLGAFKTPGLRGVAFTLPYGHGGAYGGLRSVIEAHRSCGLPAESTLAVGECEAWAQGFDRAQGRAIEAFLKVLRLDLSGHTPAVE